MGLLQEGCSKVAKKVKKLVVFIGELNPKMAFSKLSPWKLVLEK
jgi:hypothetical protein